MFGMVQVAALFTLATLLTMVSIVLLGIWGINFARFGKLERYTHALGEATICISGLAIMFADL